MIYKDDSTDHSIKRVKAIKIYQIHQITKYNFPCAKSPFQLLHFSLQTIITIAKGEKLRGKTLAG